MDASATATEPPLSQRIKALRKHLGLSVEQFGKLFFVSPRTVENWEQGIREPRGMTRAAIEKELAMRRINLRPM